MRIISSIEDLVLFLPFIQKSYPEDTHLILLDPYQVITSLPGKSIDLGIKEGIKLEDLKHTVTYRAKLEKKPVSDERGPEHFGVAYIASAVPIYKDQANQNEIIGYLTAVTSTQKHHQLQTNAHELAAMVEELSASTDEIAVSSASISVEAGTLTTYASEIANDVSTINEIV